MTAKLITQLHVRDYDTFKAVFDELRQVRQEHGAIGHRLHRAVDDPHRIVVVAEYGTADEARSFVHSTALKEAQSRAGLDGPPDFLVCEEIEAITY